MIFIEKTNKAIEESKGKSILNIKNGERYNYGENPWGDTLIANAMFCDMFPEEVKDKTNFYGFNRENYILSEIA